MKHLLLSFMVAGLLLASCKKTSTTSPSSSTPSNGWKLGTTSYTAVFAAKTGGNSLSAFDAIPSGSNPATNTCNVYFSSFPSTGGSFHIVAYAGGAVLTSTQIGVTAGLFATSKTYVSTGNDGVDATVTVTGGKIKVVIPDVWVKSTTGTDSLKLTGTIVEQ